MGSYSKRDETYSHMRTMDDKHVPQPFISTTLENGRTVVNTISADTEPQSVSQPESTLVSPYSEYSRFRKSLDTAFDNSPGLAHQLVPPRQQHRTFSFNSDSRTQNADVNRSFTSYFPSRSGSVNSTTSGQSNFSTFSSVKETNTIVRNVDPSTGNKLVNRYMMLKELGRGVHGKVKLCFDTDGMEHYAMKILPRMAHKRRLGQLGNDEEEKIRTEIAIMKKCIHPNIVRLHEVIDDPAHHKMFLVMEYVDGGELKWRDEFDKPVVSLDDAKRYFCDVVVGLEYLHYQGIVHRDIKPQNIMVSQVGRSAKIADFGVSFLAQSSHDNIGLSKTAGSPAFFAPELCIDQRSLIKRHWKTRRDVLTKSPGGLTSVSTSGQATPLPDSRFAETKWEQLSPYRSDPILHDPLHHAIPLDNSQLTEEMSPLENLRAQFSPKFDCDTSRPKFAETYSSALYVKGDDSNSEDASEANSDAFEDFVPPLVGKQIDVWALGVTLYCLIYGHLPFIAENEFELFDMIVGTEPQFAKVERSVSEEDEKFLIDLMKQLLEKDPTNRITLAQTKRHPWLRDVIPGQTEIEKEQWLHDSDPLTYGLRMAALQTDQYDQQGKIKVTEDDVRGAVTDGAVKRFVQKIKSRISKSFNNLRRSDSTSPVPMSPVAFFDSRQGSVSSPRTSDYFSHSKAPFWRRPSASSQSTPRKEIFRVKTEPTQTLELFGEKVGVSNGPPLILGSRSPTRNLVRPVPISLPNPKLSIKDLQQANKSKTGRISPDPKNLAMLLSQMHTPEHNVSPVIETPEGQISNDYVSRPITKEFALPPQE